MNVGTDLITFASAASLTLPQSTEQNTTFLFLLPWAAPSYIGLNLAQGVQPSYQKSTITPS